jgi:hypothetical protein
VLDGKVQPAAKTTAPNVTKRGNFVFMLGKTSSCAT